MSNTSDNPNSQIIEADQGQLEHIIQVMGRDNTVVNGNGNSVTKKILANFFVGEQIVTNLDREELLKGTQQIADQVLNAAEKLGDLNIRAKAISHHTTLTRSLLPATHILNLFGPREKSLLILGSPGSGKTFVLHSLLKVLAAYAKNCHDNENYEYRIPVILTLSNWSQFALSTESQTNFEQYLLNALSKEYSLSNQKTKTLIQKGQFVLLMDGLDEVDIKMRPDCAQSINAFRREYASIPMIVCCRQKDYETLSVQLEFQCSIHLEPLSSESLKVYFEQNQKHAHGSVILELVLRNYWSVGYRYLMGSPTRIRFSFEHPKAVSHDTKLDHRWTQPTNKCL